MIKSIQILRALAAWAVVYHHISQVMFQWSVSSKLMHTIALKAGNGVDIFFVISGFIIYKSISKNNITPTSFALNRMVRIIPAYWFYTLLVVVISYNFHGVIPFAEIGLNNVLKSLAFIPVMNQQIGWYIPTLTVGWTLNFEMLFYTCVFISLLFPGNNKTFCCVLIPLVVMNLFSWLGNNESTVFLFYNDELLFEFVMGVVIAICYNNGLFRNIGVKTAITISVLSLISIFFSNESKRLLQIGIPCAALIVSALCLEKNIGNSTISRIASKLGDWSYSTYLSHVIIICIINKLCDIYMLDKLLMVVPIIVLILLSSYLSYKYIEVPCGLILKRKTKIKKNLKLNASNNCK